MLPPSTERNLASTVMCQGRKPIVKVAAKAMGLETKIRPTSPPDGEVQSKTCTRPEHNHNKNAVHSYTAECVSATSGSKQPCCRDGKAYTVLLPYCPLRLQKTVRRNHNLCPNTATSPLFHKESVLPHPTQAQLHNAQASPGVRTPLTGPPKYSTLVVGCGLQAAVTKLGLRS